MTDLTPTTALGALTALDLQIGAYQIRENTGLALASLSVPQDRASQMLLGARLPEPGFLTSVAEGRHAFWTGPDQWMITSESLADTDFAAQLEADCPMARICEQTDAFVVFEIVAERAAQITYGLERIINLPPSATAPGKATRTQAHHMNLFVLRPSETRLALLCMRSQAASMLHLLGTVLRQKTPPIDGGCGD